MNEPYDVIGSTSLALAIPDEKMRARVLANINEYRTDIMADMNDNTRRAYHGDFSQYLRFCQEEKLISVSDDWRATKETIKSYVKHLVKTDLKHATIKRKLSAICFYYGILELTDPIKKSKPLRTYIKNKLRVKPAAQKQAEALTIEVLDRVNSLIKPDSLLNIRNRLLINMAFDTLFRASNMALIELGDIDRKSLSVFAPYSKSDQEGEGIYGYVSKDTLAMLDTWLDASGIEDGYVYRKLSPKHTVQLEPMTYQSIYKVFMSVSAALADGKHYSCHSTRVGATVTMTERDVPLAKIMLAGNWKSPRMAVRYGERTNVAKGGMATIR